jgi:excisionase family DNA binding protein
MKAAKETVVVEMSPTAKGRTLVEQIAAKRSAFPLQEFADLMGLDYNTIYDMTRDGRLPAMRIGSSIRLDPKTIAEWLRERTS